MSWQKELINYCDEFNIPVERLPNVVRDLKVTPMIRGVAFEYSVSKKLQNLLSKDEWKVENPKLNAQYSSHDVDVLVTHIATNKTISIECKLSAKGSFTIVKKKYKTLYSKGDVIAKVKCMRSRTMSEDKARDYARRENLDEDQVICHSDQYLPKNFHFVVTSLGNSFYQTDEDGSFIFSISDDVSKYLTRIGYEPKTDKFKSEVFDLFYIAKSSDLIPNVHKECTRKKCSSKFSCGFIPNYPIIKFSKEELKPINEWQEVNQSVVALFMSFLGLSDTVSQT